LELAEVFRERLPDAPRPELGVIGWSRWNRARQAD